MHKVGREKAESVGSVSRPLQLEEGLASGKGSGKEKRDMRHQLQRKDAIIAKLDRQLADLQADGDLITQRALQQLRHEHEIDTAFLRQTHEKEVGLLNNKLEALSEYLRAEIMSAVELEHRGETKKLHEVVMDLQRAVTQGDLDNKELLRQCNAANRQLDYGEAQRNRFLRLVEAGNEWKRDALGWKQITMYLGVGAFVRQSRFRKGIQGLLSKLQGMIEGVISHLEEAAPGDPQREKCLPQLDLGLWNELTNGFLRQRSLKADLQVVSHFELALDTLRDAHVVTQTREKYWYQSSQSMFEQNSVLALRLKVAQASQAATQEKHDALVSQMEVAKQYSRRLHTDLQNQKHPFGLEAILAAMPRAKGRQAEAEQLRRTQALLLPDLAAGDAREREQDRQERSVVYVRKKTSRAPSFSSSSSSPRRPPRSSSSARRNKQLGRRPLVQHTPIQKEPPPVAQSSSEGVRQLLQGLLDADSEQERERSLQLPHPRRFRSFVAPLTSPYASRPLHGKSTHTNANANSHTHKPPANNVVRILG
jgi:hypothetical protein